MNNNASSFSNQSTKTRNYGIDLLRLISMLMIVFLHVLGKGGILSSTKPLTLKGEIFWSIEISCYCAVNIYAIISGYVGYKSAHKGRNLISLCLQLIFFTLLITLLDVLYLCCHGESISLKSLFLNLFPTIKDYWYFSAYFCLFFFMPILDKVIDCVPRATLKAVALFCFIVFCCWTQISSSVSSLREGYSVLWLGILYVLGAYVARYNPFEKWSKTFCFLGYFVCVLLTIASKIAIGFASKTLFGEIKYTTFLVSYLSPTITLAALFLVCAFSKFTFRETVNKVISHLAPLSFGVYLIHCHPIVFSAMYNRFAWVSAKPICFAVLLVIAISLAIFIACMVLDWLRLQLFKVCKIKQFSIFLEGKIKKFIVFLLKIVRIRLEDEPFSEASADDGLQQSSHSKS